MNYEEYDQLSFEEQEEYSGRFADPTGNSALHPSSNSNPRNLPCPNCGEPNRLTAYDVARGYQCDTCADQAEWGY